jgi:predicted Zn-dependent protease
LSRRRIPKKAVRLGCGCGSLVIVILALVFFAGPLMGAYGWVAGHLRSVGVDIPKEISIPSLSKQLGVPDLPVMSPKEQITLGNDTAKKQKLDKDASSDPKIDEIAERLVKALPANYRGPAEQGGWAWQFKVLKSPDGTINALSLPGGKIYLYDGLINLTGGDVNQLAAVLAHEMAHVVEEHTAEQMRNDGLKKKATEMVLPGAAGESGSGIPQVDAAKEWATQLGEKLLTMKLSEPAEYEADDLGFQFMAAAGYDPKAGIEWLRKLESLPSASKSKLKGVFSAHPPTADRILKIEKNMASYQAKTTQR